MLIDLIFLVILVVAIFKGFSNGFIVALFSLIAYIIGIAGAMKFSTLVADWLDDSINISARWLPALSFILVFIVIVLVIRIGAAIIRKMIQAMMLGMFDRIFGILLYLVLYTIVYSVFMFFINKLNLISTETVNNSLVYGWIEPVGPFVINSLGIVLPFFQDMFKELQEFFDQIAQRAQENRAAK